MKFNKKLSLLELQPKKDFYKISDHNLPNFVFVQFILNVKKDTYKS